MGQEERPTDKRQYLLIGYVAICVVMVMLTLMLALTEGDSVEAQPTLRATATRNPIILTAQAEYATVVPTPTRSGS